MGLFFDARHRTLDSLCVTKQSKPFLSQKRSRSLMFK